jgi:uncharacterized protein YjeT (DUF2065 family)
MTDSQALATRVAARIVGPILLLAGAVVIARMDDIVLLVPGILSDGPLAFVTGMFTLICGVVLFAFHHHWKGLPAIVISLLAVTTIIRGVILMFAPSIIAGLAHAALSGAGPALIIAGLIALLIGAWLTFVGWFAKPTAAV